MGVTSKLDFFPSRIVEGINRSEACQSVNACMLAWGMPKRIKIDNGYPFANADNRDIPTKSELWWLGLGIEVRLNDPGVPQQNGIVEGLQDTTFRWVDSQRFETQTHYQQALNEAGRIQREVYRIRRHKDLTRKQLYPQLWENNRNFNPKLFSMQAIYDNLALRVWKREVIKGGTVKFWKKSIYLGKKFYRWKIYITCDPIEKIWMLRTKDGRLMKTYDKELFSEFEILEFADISKN